MDFKPIHLLLADDDKDDCLFFEEILDELSIPTILSTVYDGEQLMQFLFNAKQLPNVLFLDLNIPLKNGLECLIEIKKNPRLSHLFVIICSTSSGRDHMNELYQHGAQHYIKKPTEYSDLKKIIHKALTFISDQNFKRPSKEYFVLTVDS